MSNEEPKEPKLIVDEDWKTQVQREKQQAAEQAASQESPAAGADTNQATPVAATGDAAQGREPSEHSAAAAGRLPPATFDFLVTMLATQALMMLGRLPDESGKPPQADKPLAKHYIDLLGVLEEKTKGNLDASEQKMMTDVLHNLRMTFVQS